MAKRFKIGDHVRWNSEAGRVSGTIIAIHTTDFDYKGHVHHASERDPQDYSSVMNSPSLNSWTRTWHHYCRSDSRLRPVIFGSTALLENQSLVEHECDSYANCDVDHSYRPAGSRAESYDEYRRYSRLNRGHYGLSVRRSYNHREKCRQHEFHFIWDPIRQSQRELANHNPSCGTEDQAKRLLGVTNKAWGKANNCADCRKNRLLVAEYSVCQKP
jgi:hypothetical protein